MKKIVAFLGILLLSATLFACRHDTTTETSGTTTSGGTAVDCSDIITTYASGVEFNVYKYRSTVSLPEVYININFTAIEYIPLRNKFNLQFDVSDSEYVHASYYAILQGTSTTLTYQQIQFYGSGNGFSAAVSFTIPDRTKDYRILIGKYDTDNLNLNPGQIEASAWIEWTDSNIGSRGVIDSVSLTDTTAAYTTDLSASFASYDIGINDPGHTISQALVILREPLGTAVDSYTFNTTGLYSGNTLDLTGQFNDLAPNVNYEIEAYISGNDGVDDFTNLYVSETDLCSAGLKGQQDRTDDIVSYHGLYAVIYDAEVTVTNLILSYVYVNDGKISYSDSGDLLELHLEYTNLKTGLMANVPLTTGDHTVNIPLENLEEGSTIRFYDQRDSQMFERYVLPDVQPDLYVYRIDDNNFEIRSDSDLSVVVDFDVAIYVEGYAALFESFENVDIAHDNSFTLYHDMSDLDAGFDVVVTMTYLAYGKELTVTIKL